MNFSVTSFHRTCSTYLHEMVVVLAKVLNGYKLLLIRIARWCLLQLTPLIFSCPSMKILTRDSNYGSGGTKGRHAPVTDTKSVRSKLMCGAKAFQSISVEHCAISFPKKGLCPFQRDSAKRLQLELIEVMDSHRDREHDEETADA